MGESKTVGFNADPEQVRAINDAKRPGETRAEYLERTVMADADGKPFDRFLEYVRYMAGGATAVMLLLGVLYALGTVGFEIVGFSGVIAGTFVLSWALAQLSDVSYRIATGE